MAALLAIGLAEIRRAAGWLAACALLVAAFAIAAPLVEIGGKSLSPILIASQVELQITQRASHAPSTPREKRAGETTVAGSIDDSVFICRARTVEEMSPR